MTRSDFMNYLYRLQGIQQMAVGMPGIIFKVDTFTTRDNLAAVEWILLRGDEYLKSGILTEDCEDSQAEIVTAELRDYIGKRGWI